MERKVELTIKTLRQVEVAGHDNLNNIIASIRELENMNEDVNMVTLSAIIEALERTSVRGERNMLLMFAAISNLNSIMEENSNEDHDKQG